MITQHDEIAGIFVDYYTIIYRSNMKINLRKYIRRNNDPFTEKELKTAIKQQKDNIYLQKIKKLLQESLEYLLNLYNRT